MNQKKISLSLSIIISSLSLASVTYGDVKNKFIMDIKGDNRCFISNGIPNHTTGDFPVRGNPNEITEQSIHVCVPRSPKRNKELTPIRGIMGIAMNGVLFRPSTAGYWDPTARRQRSRNGDRRWNVEIFGVRGQLGLDFNNAHVGRGGLYHYHGVPTGLVESKRKTLIGYAGDGFEIHYVKDLKTSGWELKHGERPSGLLGKYDGTYVEDYHYVGGSDRLDKCNGGIHNGKYSYFITNTFPFVPRCLYGNVSNDFNKSRH